MKYKPGERVSYSNSGYLFLALIIEKITGESYFDIIHKCILKPLDLSNTGFYKLNDLPENCANGYLLKNGRWVNNIYNLTINGAGDTGIYTTADDLKLFWQALLSNNLLNKKITDTLLEAHVTMWESIDYGLGIYINREVNDISYVICGGDPGIGFYSRYFPHNNRLITIFTNKSDQICNIADSIIKLIC